MIQSSAARAWSASTVTQCCQHREGTLEQLQDLVLGQAGGLNLGFDALDHRAPAAGLLLLVGHHFTVWKWLSSELSQLTCQQQNI